MTVQHDTSMIFLSQTFIMHSRFLIAAVFATVGWSYPTTSICTEVDIPVSVAATRFLITTTIENDWDAVSLTFNLTRRDSGNATTAPLPIAGTTSSPVRSDFVVGPTFENAERYSFVDAAVAAGYAVLSYDRIGVGSSSKVDALQDAQFQVQTAVLDELIVYARKIMNAKHVGLIGHSYGSYLSAGSANHSDVDAVVLTGFSGAFDYFTPFVAGAGFRIANQQNTSRWGDLDSAYLTTSDIYATTYIYYKEPYFEQRVAEWNHHVAAEPFAVGELPSLLASYNNFHNVTAPVLLLQGQFDLSACGGNCLGFPKLKDEALRDDVFQNAKSIEVINDLPAG
ncbi:unnamed protein product [Periconia digitata]|uniref:AB hydrolase-1 domain-containing protein n=1 Tax=Periconia digitata TaxID=1303443 RepID=A0A9W4U8W0_9PLEO|nr:unnamed protein product [Periconia digitata]